MPNARLQQAYTNDSLRFPVRKAHNSGRNHLSNVRDYYASLGHDKAQSIIDQITSAYESGGPPPGGFGFGPQHLGGPPPGYGGPPMGGFGGPPPFGGPMPPFPPPAGFQGGAPPFPPNGMPPPGMFPGGVPPFPPNGQMPPFRPSNDGVVPAGGMPGPPSSFNGPPPDASGTSSTIPPPGSGGMPGGMHPDRLRMLGK